MMLSPSADVDGARLPSGGRAEDSLLELEPEVDRGVQHAPKRTIFPSLEGLPTELRTALLLNLPDLTTLSRLVHASVVFHAQYLLDRKSILSRALLSDATDDVFVDVYAAFRSHSSRIGPLRGPNTNVTGFLASLRAYRSPSATDRPIPETCQLDEICWMARFHQSIVGPLATHFVSWALANFRSGPVQPNAKPLWGCGSSDKIREGMPDTGLLPL